MSQYNNKKEQVFNHSATGKRLRIMIIAIIAVICVIAGAFVLLRLNRNGSVSGAEANNAVRGTRGRYTIVQPRNGEFHFKLSEFSDGMAHYYTYDSDSKSISFFILKSTDGVIRAAFDACDVCFAAKKGYRQEGEIMICNNCGQAFYSNRINLEKGGCNPAPLDRETRGDTLVITAENVLSGSRLF